MAIWKRYTYYIYSVCLTNYNKQKCFKHNNYYSYLSETNAFKRQTDDDKFEHIQAVFLAFCFWEPGMIHKVFVELLVRSNRKRLLQMIVFQP